MKRQVVVLLCAAAACSMIAGTLLAFIPPEAPAKRSYRTLTFAERVAYQRAIEDVYWRHRVWPKERPDPKPPLDAVMSQVQLAKKVEGYLGNSQALKEYWQQPLSAEQLQGEMERMAQHTRQPEVLRELFEALGNDPFVVAECLARPTLAERLVTSFYGREQRFHGELGRREESWRAGAENQTASKVAAIDSIAKAVHVNRPYHLPTISDGPNGCIDDTWTATSTTNAPSARYLHTAVWTGSEMIEERRLGDNFTTGGGRNNTSNTS